MVRPTRDDVDALIADLTPLAAKPSRLTGEAPTADALFRSYRLFHSAGGWAGIFLDEGGIPLMYYGCAKLEGTHFATGLVTNRLVDDRRLLIRMAREIRKRLEGTTAYTFFQHDAGTELLHRHAGWRRADEQPAENYTMMVTGG